MEANQKVEYIALKDLVLWTENPRDPIFADATDQDIVDKALSDKNSKWTLSKLAKEMGDYYDLSELPTVVYHGKKPIVYDGNRRMILAKIKHGLVLVKDHEKISLPEFPEKIPCNVCDKKIALQNVYRKHSDSGSWQPLERDIFLHKFMGQEKSAFLILEEDTGFISANPHLNKRFVKEEVFKEETLSELGLKVDNGRLRSLHSDEETKAILSDISGKVQSKNISTRSNRGKVVEVLDPVSQEIIDSNKNNRSHVSKVKFSRNKPATNILKQTKRINPKPSELFGGKLYLRMGDVSDLYRDIVDLHEFYIGHKEKLSNSFSGLIRMSLRLLCETAAKEDNNKKLENYIKGYFENAKKTLDKDVKTTLSVQNVNESSIVQLLHTGAHNYQSTNNMEQTIAISLVVGAIITLTHGKKVF